jgi:hypothetical protein
LRGGRQHLLERLPAHGLAVTKELGLYSSMWALAVYGPF